MTTPPTIIFAGGGTGGHIVPALAIAEARRTLGPVRTVHIGGDRDTDQRMHADALASGTADAVHHIPARPFSMSPKGLARLAGSWGACVRTVRGIIRDERERTGSVVLVAMGGYIAAPAAQAARAERCPLALVNLDAVAGLANRWIAKRASTRFAVGSEPPRPTGLGWTVINPIVKPSFKSLPTPAAARTELGLAPDRPTLLVTGGSLGARSVNGFLLAFASAHTKVFTDQRWQVLHQTGTVEDDAVSHAYTALGVDAVVTPLIARMDLAWAAADAAVGRAGAGTVAESWATATPTLFMPYPYHKDQHQRRNAQPLDSAGAGLLATDRIDPGANLAEHGHMLSMLLSDPAARSRMRLAFETLGPADGAEHLARVILGPPRA